MSKNLKELAEKIVNLAKQNGATAAEGIARESISHSVEVKNGSLEKIEGSEQLKLGARVFIGLRSASVSISNTENSYLENMISRAIAMAKQAPEDEFSGLAEVSQYASNFNIKNFDLLDKSFNDIKPDTLVSLAEQMTKSALDVPGANLSEGGVGCNLTKFHMTDSNGFSSGYSRTNFQLFCSTIAGENSQMERDYASESRVYFEELPDPDCVGNLSATRAVSRLNPKASPTGSYPVLYDERISSTLISHLISAINGASIARGSSWLLDSLEEKVLPQSITLSEEPKRPRIAGSRPFDSEGLPTSKKNLIKDGRLKQLVLDLRSARQLNLEPKGNASGVTNLRLSTGRKSQSEIISEIKNGFLVTSLIGSSVNQNTGDYSRGAGGYWIKDGEIVYPINRCTIAGNLKEMLINITQANDSKNTSSYEIPSLLVENMIVAGK